MAEYKVTLTVGKTRADKINNALNWKEGDAEDFRLGEEETFTETAVFENGLEMDVKCCGASEGEAWTEAVLFAQNGSELAASEPSEGFFGEWELGYEGDLYHVEVIEAA